MAEPAPEAIISSPYHLPGLTRVAFSQDGTIIFTGGKDALIRIHKVEEPESEPGFHDAHSDTITSLACSATHLMSASLDASATIHSHPGEQYEGFLSRSAGVPIRWVSVDKQGERVAICGDDLLVKLVYVNDRERVASLSDNPKSVRSAAWDPTGKYLVTAGCDGKVKIYDMGGTAPLNLKIMDGVISPSESDAERSCYAAWHPSGKYFAIPLRTNDIGIVNREGWTKQVAFSSDDIRSLVSELAWSPNGKYLASSSGSQILIWTNDTRSVVAKYNSADGVVTGLAWSPTSNLLAFALNDGSLARWADPIPDEMPSPFASEVAEQKRVDKILDDFGDDDIDMEDFGGEDLEDDEEPWIVDDDVGGRANGRSGLKDGTELVNVTKAQPSFTPGSTSWKGKKRYLAFNMIGAVDSSDQDVHNVVNVEFHDKSARRGYHFQDHHKYTLASMGEQGISFACGSADGEPSEIHYRPYDSWASQAEWTLPLPKGESATCIATGGPAEDAGFGHVVVSTSKGFVRFFTASGVQRYLWTLGEDVVSMSAGREALFVVHREGGTSLDGCQNLRFTVMDLDTFDILQEGRIPLAKKTTLTWLGWSAEGAPAIYDSTGVLSMLDRFRRWGQARWVPILDSALLKKDGRTESYWPVGITMSHMTCAILKGKEKEPSFPRPLLQEVALQMPLLNLDSAAGKLEESVMRGHVLVSLLSDIPSYDAESATSDRRVLTEKELLQLVQTACKSDNLARAYDLARMMLNPQTVESAAKIASYYHLGGLEGRIQDLRGESKGRAKKVDRLEKERAREMERRFPAEHVVNGGRAGGRAKNGDTGFAPRATVRRSFGGVNRAETPMSTATSSAREPYIPETPTHDDDYEPPVDFGVTEREASPGEKRKRRTEQAVDDGFSAAPKKRGEGFAVPAEPKKNPFAKPAAASNPFAKPASTSIPPNRSLDAVKSTSFFDRVDNIESSGAPKAKPKATKASKAAATVTGSSSGGAKQTTLAGLQRFKLAPPVPTPVHSDSMASTDTETDEAPIGVEETQRTDTETEVDETQMDEEVPEKEVEEEPANVLGGEQVGSPEPEEGAEDMIL